MADLEVVMYDKNTNEKHIADCVLANGTIIEVQHSPIKVDEIKSREAFYGNMIWVPDFETMFKLDDDNIMIPRRKFIYEIKSDIFIIKNDSIYYYNTKLFHNYIRVNSIYIQKDKLLIEDVKTFRLNYKRLKESVDYYKKFEKDYNEALIIDNTTFTFGKYKGISMFEINDNEYIKWAINNVDISISETFLKNLKNFYKYITRKTESFSVDDLYS